jgi:DNA-directed RNA polymerase specialized sigma24 family protein
VVHRDSMAVPPRADTAVAGPEEHQAGSVISTDVSALPGLGEYPGPLSVVLVDFGLRDRAAGVVLRQRLLDPAVSPVEQGRVEQMLGRYGLRAVGAMIRDGRMFAAAQRRGRSAGEDPTCDWDRHDLDDLTVPTVNLGLKYFAARGLHRWSPERGTALRSWFIGGCALYFADVYRPWQKARSERQQHQSAPLSVIAVAAAPGAGETSGLSGAVGAVRTGWGRRAAFNDPEELVIQRAIADEALASVGDSLNQQIICMVADGDTQQEIAAELGLSERAVEGRLRRIRQRVIPSPGKEGEKDA